MSVTKAYSEITDDDLPFVAAKDNGDGTVTIYYSQDTIPTKSDQPTIWTRLTTWLLGKK